MLLRERYRPSGEKFWFPRRVNPAINLSFCRARRGNSDVPRITIRHLQRAESVSEQALLRVRSTCRDTQILPGNGSSLDTPPPPPPTPAPRIVLLLLVLLLLAIPSLSSKKNRYTYLKYSTYLSALRLDDARGVTGHRLRGSRATATGQS